MNKLSLANIILNEGIHIELQNPVNYRSAIVNAESSLEPIPGEQLIYVQGSRKAGLEVRYSLEANKEVDARERKTVMDVLKTRYDEIQGILTPLLLNAATRIKPPDVVYFLGSSDNTSERLAEFFGNHFGVPHYPVRKSVFNSLLYFVDWSKFEDTTDAEDTIKKVRDKEYTREILNNPTIEQIQDKFNRSDGTIRIVIGRNSYVNTHSPEEFFETIRQREDISRNAISVSYRLANYEQKKDLFHYTVRNKLKSKYSVNKNRIYYSSYDDYINDRNGIKLNLNNEGELSLVEAISQGQNVLIVDDNIHSGNDIKTVIDDIIDSIDDLGEIKDRELKRLAILRSFKRMLSKANKNSYRENEEIFQELMNRADFLRTNFQVNITQNFKDIFIKTKFKTLRERISEKLESSRDLVNHMENRRRELAGQIQVYTLYSLSDEDV